MCNLAQVLVKRSPTLGTLVSTKTKCIKLIFIGKILLVPIAFLMALSIFVDQQSPDDRDISDDEDAKNMESLDYIRSISPPDKKEIKVLNRIYGIGG